MKKIHKSLYFSTPVFSTNYFEHVKKLNKLCDPYIKNMRQKNIKDIKKSNDIPKRLQKDFGMSHHSVDLKNDPNFKFLIDLIIEHSNHFIENSGFNVKDKKLLMTELWAQEFAKLGGGHHSTHAHWNQHVSGFYFLKCSELTSFPRFYDPRAGAVMTKLPQTHVDNVTSATDIVHYKVKPGDMIIFPGYLLHEFSVDHGIEPFRFIHWNIQYV